VIKPLALGFAVSKAHARNLGEKEEEEKKGRKASNSYK
jgi:hypothetical protein